ncbi:NUDIX hydrolase [Paenibacillus alvei]|uniref:8-oxo-dGTP diphosphatase n=1 Tax=Paenibacillus alvei TaxID=44250 RepID=A0AAP7DHW9_PAEAL|nr:8-oxo-dGTP diphosphatase [Paenibacillus alvei]NEZ41062.1 NUDIX domain-containing protein [Paenibacillus alvei]NOJ70056.1 8-oxo-dGTP diphosphatase [Paenibacillus alvei]
MLIYNICYIQRGNEVLLLNREKPSWMGCWNGIGGKLEAGESPRESMERELAEETGITPKDLTFKGIVSWMVDRTRFGGMYLYAASVEESFTYDTPMKTDEGILDWKRVDWIMDVHNQGVASNMPQVLQGMRSDLHCYDYHCIFEKGKLLNMIAIQIDPALEWDEVQREVYLEKYAVMIHSS